MGMIAHQALAVTNNKTNHNPFSGSRASSFDAYEIATGF